MPDYDPSHREVQITCEPIEDAPMLMRYTVAACVGGCILKKWVKPLSRDNAVITLGELALQAFDALEEADG